MLPLQSEIDSLCAVSHELLHLGLDGEPIYSDRFRQLNTDVYRQCEQLVTLHGNTIEEEASPCIASLTGYNATIYNHGDKEEKIQSVLDCCRATIDKFSTSPLKCQLLVVCYAEVSDEELAKEAHEILDSWKSRKLSEEETEALERLVNLEKNPYPHINEERQNYIVDSCLFYGINL